MKLISILDFFIPRFCVHCKTKLENKDEIICQNCFIQLTPPSKFQLEYEYNKKFSQLKIVDEFYSLFNFETDGVLQSAIHSLKYLENIKAGIFLGELLGKHLKQIEFIEKHDILIPVPLHKSKKLERGFNQSYYICKGIQKITHNKINQRIISRIKYTPSQTALNIEERRLNVKDAFKLNKRKHIEGQTFVLVDDVITTGSTIQECAKTLKDNGAKKIIAVSCGIVIQ